MTGSGGGEVIATTRSARSARPRRKGRGSLRLVAIAVPMIVVAVLLYLTAVQIPRAQTNQTLVLAAREGDVALVGDLLDQGADPNARDKPVQSGLDALRELVSNLFAPFAGRGAARAGSAAFPPVLAVAAGEMSDKHAAVVALLLDRGANPNARFGVPPANTALHVAATRHESLFSRLHGYQRGPHLTILCTLLAHGADINARDSNGRTALMNNAISGNYWAARLLLQGGADVNARDKNGSTALTLARASKEPGTILLLQEHGAQP